MRARKYTKKIQVWQTTKVSDGFGGNGVTNELITSTWCEIITLDKLYRNTDFGVTDTANTIVIRLRKRNDLTYNSLNQFFKYRGEKYLLQGTPINVGFEDREIQITLTRESVKGANDITPIGGDVFPYTFPYQLA